MEKPVTLMDILTSSGKYPEREQSPECTGFVLVAAHTLSERVSALLWDLGMGAKVSSGFRTSATNGAAGGAKKSAHMSGEAVDLEDPQGTIANAIMAAPTLLEKHGLYMESPQHTKGWIHLTTRAPKSGNRIFIP